MNLEWCIVGGGLHGVHIAVRLLASAGVAPERLRIVDPAPKLLQRWMECTAATGMAYMRSPAVHHLDVEPMSLQKFAGKRKHRDPALFTPPYDRPSLGLFNAHCAKVVSDHGLEDLHVRARATSCDPGEDRAILRLSDGQQIETRHLVLALGASEQPHWPEWAPRGHPRIEHLFQPGLQGPLAPEESVAVIGGGISAAQAALRLASEGHRVHLVSRHALREHQFDSDPGWLGPKHMGGFVRERDHDRRRALITEARHRGSLPPDTASALKRAIHRQRIHQHQAEPTRLDAREDSVVLHLGSASRLAVDRVLLATGFDPRRPGGALVDALATSANLPCARCGYPIVDTALRWHPRIHVAGPLAELELGPVSRNIAGARRAAERLAAAAAHEPAADRQWRLPPSAA